jgi:hypothetical protein
MKKIVTMLFAIVSIASQTMPIQAMPVISSAKMVERNLRTIPPLDAVHLYNQFTVNTASTPLWVNDIVDPIQDQDTTPPQIGFAPQILTIFTFPNGGYGTITSVAVDLDSPFVVTAGAATAVGVLDVFVDSLTTYFDLIQIQLPGGQVGIGVGFVSFARYGAFYNPFSFICPCGTLDVTAVDIAGNVGNGLATVVAVH